MKSSRDDIISGLCASAAPRAYAPYAHALAEIIGASAVSLICVGAAYGVRPDIEIRLQEPLFITEIALHIALILTASVTAAALAFPDRAHGRYILRVLYSVLIAYCGFALFVASPMYPVSADDAAHHHAHGIACAGCLVSFAVIPALWGVWRISRLAAVRPALAGFTALIAAAATGSLGVRLVESEIVPHGLFAWHIMPFILLALAGMLAGKKIFRSV